MALAVLAALALAAPTGAKLIPRFDRQAARPGERVRVVLGPGLENFRAPVRVYLVRIGRRTAYRRIATLRAGPYGIINVQRFCFSLPAVPTGRYRVAMLVRGGDDKWHDVVGKLWRAPNLTREMILRVR